MTRTRKIRTDSEAENNSWNYFVINSEAEQSVAGIDLSKKVA